jgi:hypothetical protein
MYIASYPTIVALYSSTKQKKHVDLETGKRKKGKGRKGKEGGEERRMGGLQT